MTPAEQAALVLQLVAQRDMDGYTLAAKSGLKLSELEAAVRLLLAKGLLRVKGDTGGPRLMDSWFQAPSGALQSFYPNLSGFAP